jgi:hypothetical protein
MNVGHRSKNLVGRKFGLLKVVSFVGRNKRSDAIWSCLCRCGGRTINSTDSLTSGNARSCGCRRVNLRRGKDAPCFRHGLAATPEYSVWRAMIQRCRNPRNPAYRNYGARGITVCDRWAGSFADFIADMGLRPYKGLSIERINNAGHYEPGNCKWATKIERCQNTRKTHFLTLNGTTRSCSEWAKILGIGRSTLYARLRYGWTDEEALVTPIQPRRTL